MDEADIKRVKDVISGIAAREYRKELTKATRARYALLFRELAGSEGSGS